MTRAGQPEDRSGQKWNDQVQNHNNEQGKKKHNERGGGRRGGGGRGRGRARGETAGGAEKRRRRRYHNNQPKVLGLYQSPNSMLQCRNRFLPQCQTSWHQVVAVDFAIHSVLNNTTTRRYQNSSRERIERQVTDLQAEEQQDKPL